MDQNLGQGKDSKVVLITGASRGIGLACAKRFAEGGYRVALHYRSDSDLAGRVAEQLGNCEVFQADLSDSDACLDLVSRVKKSMGRIDTVINNAGVSKDQLITFAKVEDFDTLVSTNLRSVFLIAKAASRLMIKQKGGQIINMSSVVGFTGNGGQSLYSATKSGIIGLTKSMAMDLAGFGIRCNAIAPGFIETEMTTALDSKVQEAILSRIPLARLGEAGDVANAAYFLASNEAAYITGSTLHVNGGMYTN